MPVTVADADPDAWMRAPLFVGRAEDAATVDPMQLDGQSGDGSRGVPGIDAATVAPQLDRLFVARPAAVRPQDRKSVGQGKSVSVRVSLGGRRYLKKKKKHNKGQVIE